jgi:hypothetical protein
LTLAFSLDPFDLSIDFLIMPFVVFFPLFGFSSGSGTMLGMLSNFFIKLLLFANVTSNLENDKKNQNQKLIQKKTKTNKQKEKKTGKICVVFTKQMSALSIYLSINSTHFY